MFDFAFRFARGPSMLKIDERETKKMAAILLRGLSLSNPRNFQITGNKETEPAAGSIGRRART